MGGFAGGDEGGYWDVGALSEDIKKNSLNTPLKKRLYTQTSESSYEIEALSKRGELYGVLSFVPMKCKTFTIEGCEVIELKACTVYQAYRALLDFTDDSDIVDFFHMYKVVITKSIDTSLDNMAYSSFGAVFIILVKELCSLVLNSDELEEIGSSVGPDVPGFIRAMTN